MIEAKIIDHGPVPNYLPREWTIQFDDHVYDVALSEDGNRITGIWALDDDESLCISWRHQLTESEIGADAMAEISKQITKAIADWAASHDKPLSPWR